jgi:hypothetical protein
MWATLSDRTKGTILCLVGVMFLIPDSLCIQEISPAIPQHSVILYKYIGFTLVLTIAHVLSNPNDIWGSYRLDGGTRQPNITSLNWMRQQQQTT